MDMPGVAEGVSIIGVSTAAGHTTVTPIPLRAASGRKLAARPIEVKGIGPVDARFGKVTIYATEGGRLAVGVKASAKGRDISIGGNAYTEAVQKELDLPFDAAEQLKKGIPVDGATFEEAQPVLRAITENVLLEIQKTFDFFRSTASSDQMDRIMLSGGASRVDGFREMLQERFNAPVEEFDPFRAVGWDPRKLPGDPADVAATAAVAVGLALRKVTDR